MMAGVSMLGINGVISALDYQSFGTATYRVGTNVEYAIHVEFGTSSNQAQPYLRPAVEKAIVEIDQISWDNPQELVETLALKVESYAKDNAPVDTGNLQGSIKAERVS